jgi:hypothetical protein
MGIAKLFYGFPITQEQEFKIESMNYNTQVNLGVYTSYGGDAISGILSRFLYAKQYECSCDDLYKVDINNIDTNQLRDNIQKLCKEAGIKFQEPHWFLAVQDDS